MHYTTLVLKFKPSDQIIERTYTIYVPVAIESSDGSLETRGMCLPVENIVEAKLDFTKNCKMGVRERAIIAEYIKAAQTPENF